MFNLGVIYVNPRFRIRLWDKPTSQMTKNVMINPQLPLSITASFCDYSIVYSGDRLKDIILMQCTGLLDMSSNLIYEEDIVKTDIGPILLRYCDRCKQVQPYTIYHGKPECLACGGDLNWVDMVDCKMEVIGNYLQNPELMEEKYKESL